MNSVTKRYRVIESSDRQIQLVQKLLREHVRREDIVARLGVAKGFVDAVAIRLAQQNKPSLSRNGLTVDEISLVAQRCPTCGAKVVMPCRRCSDERVKAAKRLVERYGG